MRVEMDRFFSKVDVGLCWEWTGWLTTNGYGGFDIRVGGKPRKVRAHRWLYEQLVGTIGTGLELDHLCRNRLCVNPDHLDPVTHKENARRGAAGAVNAARYVSLTHCGSGHQYVGDNVTTSAGRRICRTCNRIKSAQYRARKKGQAVA
jgi:hypothetical protein